MAARLLYLVRSILPRFLTNTIADQFCDCALQRFRFLVAQADSKPRRMGRSLEMTTEQTTSEVRSHKRDLRFTCRILEGFPQEFESKTD
jgi:hypothetical protein